MTKKKYILACTLMIAGLLSFNSCDKNLDISISKPLEVNYFSSEFAVYQGVGAAYAELTNIYGPDLVTGSKQGFWLLPADDITADGTGNPLETFSGLNGTNGPVNGMWKTLYKVIARCNFMLDYLQGGSLDAIIKTPGLKDAEIAEMLFIRSWCNFKLWDNWRKAPLQEKRIKTPADAVLPPSKDFELLDNAITSLETAAPLAQVTWNNQNLGRITKDACYGLLVKLYVTRACYNSKNADDYNKAITAFSKISSTTMSAFGTVSYGDNFDYRTENNPESLFEFQASLDISDNPWLDNDFGNDVSMMSAFYHYEDSSWTNYSSGIFGPTDKLVAAFDPADPRKGETLRGTDITVWAYYIVPAWGKFNNNHLVKYENGARGNCIDPQFGTGSANNTRLLRLADVKLCVAEAYLATGNTGAALVQVNDVRSRARNSVSPASSAPADLLSVAIADIMNERMLELAGEDGHRWSDLKRWHAAGYINLSTWTAADFGFPSNYDPALFKFDVSKNLLYPIPTVELSNNPQMAASGQNPGY